MRLRTTFIAVAALITSLLPPCQAQIQAIEKTRIEFNPSSPSVTLSSAACPASGCQDALTLSLSRVVEATSQGVPLPGRDAALQGNWQEPTQTATAAGILQTVFESPVTLLSPCPDGQAPVAISSTTAAEAPTDSLGGASTLIVFSVDAITAAINVTGTSGEPLELLPGNLKLSTTVESWPFCSVDNTLIVQYAFVPTGANPARRVEATVLVQGVDELEPYLLGQVDPNSVPLEENVSQAQPPAAVPPSAGRRLLESFPRRVLLRGGGRGGGGGWGGSKLGGSSGVSGSSGTTNFGGSFSGSKPSFGGSFSPNTPYRPYFPGGGYARPRFGTSAGAINTLPFSARETGFLSARYLYRRPVWGMGMYGRGVPLPFFWWFFPLEAYGAVSQPQDPIEAKLAVDNVAFIDSGPQNVTVLTLSGNSGPNSQLLEVKLPSFSQKAVYELVATVAESEELVDNEINQAVIRVQAYDEVTSGSSGISVNMALWCIFFFVQTLFVL
jgi:hypothetical protein